MSGGPDNTTPPGGDADRDGGRSSKAVATVAVRKSVAASGADEIVRDADHQGRTDVKSGLIGMFVRHRTAPNLLMAIMVLIGLFSLLKLNRQFFPTFDIPTITVQVVWPGAIAEDVESNILDVLEPELRFLDNVDEVTSIASEGAANITLEFTSGADLQKAQSDVEQAVAQVRTLPEDSERPIISRNTLFDRVAKISISGPFTEQVLNTYAKQIRDGLLANGIDRVNLNGARDEEIWIQVRDQDLRRLGLTLDQISERVRVNTQDLPAGVLEGDIDVQLRAKSERKTPEAIGEIEIVATADGQKILLRDIADINTRFEREGKIGLVGENPGIELQVERAVTADTLTTMDNMTAYLDKVRPTLPPTLDLKLYDVTGKFVVQRLGILIENGLQGLVLVLAMLFIFLNARIAFWVAVGIPVALLAALGVMFLTGQSINMISMFALIMMLGIIVDDAIVVGEQAATLEQQGLSSLDAAEQGAMTMLPPVTAATLTTMAAFLPIVLIGDRIGDIMVAIPLVVLAVLIASLIECFLVLPGHLRHANAAKRKPTRFRAAVDRGFDKLRDGWFNWFVRKTYAWRYTTLAVLVGAFILAVGMISGGRVGFVFFPSPEPENLTASIIFTAGTPREDQIKLLTEVERALYVAEQKLTTDTSSASAGKNQDASTDAEPSETELGIVRPKAANQLVVAMFTLIGRAERAQGDNLAQINVQLQPSEDRTVPTKAVVKAWQTAIPKLPGIERVAIAGRQGGPPGRDIDVQLQNGTPDQLKAAAEDLKQALSNLPGISAVDDDLPYGKQEFVFELTPRGRALGFTGTSIGQQIRNAFEGAVATRFARGDEEITVRVKRRQERQGRADLALVYVSTPAGDRVALSEVVDLSERRSFSIIQRRNGVRSVSVTANVDNEVISADQVLATLRRDVLPGVTDKHGVTYEFRGRAEETRESFADLKTGALLSLCLIYIVLAWVFGSYWKPLAVMAIIPFGFVGATVGHYVMGYPLTIISMIGLLGLSGILVNDSIVLVSRIRERIDFGQTLEEAAVGGARDRLRAVLLTSLTTVGGLTPLLFETSQQAQFLIPMAVTIVFGLAAATVLVLILVPSLIGIGGDIGRTVGGAYRWIYQPGSDDDDAPDDYRRGGRSPAPVPAE